MKVWTSSFERGSSPVVGSSSRRSVGRGQQGSRDGDLLLHAPAHLLDRAPHPLLGDAEPGEDPDRLGPGLAGMEAVEAGGEGQVLVRRELLEEGGVHAHPVDEALDRHLVPLHVVAEDLRPTLVKGQEGGHEADEGALAAPVGAEDPVDLAPLNAQRDVVDGRHRLLLPAHHERLGDVLQVEGGRPDGPRGGGLGDLDRDRGDHLVACRDGPPERDLRFGEGAHGCLLRLGGRRSRWRGARSRRSIVRRREEPQARRHSCVVGPRLRVAAPPCAGQ